MKNTCAVIILALSIISCNKTPEFVAQIDGVEDNTKVYLSKLGKNNQPEPTDTTDVIGGSFKFELLDQEPQALNLIRIDGVAGNMFFIKEDLTINATLYKDSLRSSVINGGKNNTLLTNYIDSLEAISNEGRMLSLKMREAMVAQDQDEVAALRDKQKQMQDKDIEFRKRIAEDNPSSIVAALALSDLLSSKRIPNTELRAIYDAFSNDVKDHTVGKLLNENIAKISKTDVGAKVDNFEAPTPEGELLSLEDVKGKLTLIDFWASWCKPCRMENPNVVKVYNEFKDKGFSIISISLDKNRESWVKAIEDDNMDWHHISNLQSWNEPIAKSWGVRSIPSTFLIDENGIIVGTNLRGEALRKKVSEYLQGNG